MLFTSSTNDRDGNVSGMRCIATMPTVVCINCDLQHPTNTMDDATATSRVGRLSAI
jgi:hypothetical protein